MRSHWSVFDKRHRDQITRYVDKNFNIHERFAMMCEIKGKTSVKFAVKVTLMVKDLNLPKGDVRFQYDTTPSMSGHYNGQ